MNCTELTEAINALADKISLLGVGIMLILAAIALFNQSKK